MHLALDLVFNGRQTPRSIVAFYSFAYRLPTASTRRACSATSRGRRRPQLLARILRCEGSPERRARLGGRSCESSSSRMKSTLGEVFRDFLAELGHDAVVVRSAEAALGALRAPASRRHHARHQPARHERPRFPAAAARPRGRAAHRGHLGRRHREPGSRVPAPGRPRLRRQAGAARAPQRGADVPGAARAHAAVATGDPAPPSAGAGRVRRSASPSASWSTRAPRGTASAPSCRPPA